MRSGEPLPAVASDRTCKVPRSQKERGFTLFAVLAAMLLVGLASQGVMTVVSQQSQRDREAELLRIGTEYVHAIGAYYESSPGTVKVWPPSLDALTDDRRFVTLRRHLRRVYPDPITRTNEWGIVPAVGGGVAGVYSKSERQPIREAGGALAELGIGAAQRYSDWKFVYVPKVPALAPQGARP